jgi:hypothetical protein
MTRTPASATRALTAAMDSASALALTLAPVAHADPLDPIRGAVNGARAQSACGPLNYSIALEGEAQAAVGNQLPGVPPAGNYNGNVTRFNMTGDPASEAIKNVMSQASSAIKDCKYKDFGVGFYRVNDSFDDVGIALGQPPAPAPAPPPAPAPAPAPAQAPVEQAPPVTDAISLSFGPPGLASIRGPTGVRSVC